MAVQQASVVQPAADDRYDYLFERFMEALKPALAVVIIYYISFYFGWDRPYWATVSAFSVNLMCRGMTIYRGVIRVSGTFLGGFAGLAVIALFPQERWSYQIAAMVPLFLFAYGCSGKNEYLYVVAGITFSVVMGVAWTVLDWDSDIAYRVVMLRITQTWMGSFTMVLISVYIWPHTSIERFDTLASQIWDNQHRLLHAVRGVMSGEDKSDEIKQLRLNDIDYQEDIHFVHHLAENDSFEMMETGHDWHEYLHLAGAQAESYDSLRQSLADIPDRDVYKLFPNLDAQLDELDRRFEQTGGMLVRTAPTAQPEHFAPSVNQDEFEPLSRSEKAAITLIKMELASLEAVSRSLFDCVARIRMFAEPDAEHHGHGGHDHGGPAVYRPIIALDLDRVYLAFGILTAVWIGLLSWIYIYDVPNKSIFWAMCGVLAFVINYRFEMRGSTLLWSWGVGLVAAGLCYVIIMQELSGYREFAIMVVIVCFAMGFIWYPRSHPGARMFTLISFTIVVSAENYQHYELEHYISYVLWIWLTLSIPIVAKAIFTPWRPDKLFLRLYDRFFYQAHLMISTNGPEGPRNQGMLYKFKMIFFQDDLTNLPRKCALYASEYDSFKLTPNSKTIDPEDVGTTRAKLEELLMSMFLLAYRVKGFVKVCQLPRMDAVMQQLAEEEREWYQLIEEWFEHYAKRPKKAPELTAHIPQRLAELESRVDDAFERIDKSAFSAEDSENFYRLMSAYRSLSDAIVSYARVAGNQDWPRWRELRF